MSTTLAAAIRQLTCKHDWQFVMDGHSEDCYRCSVCGKERWEQHFAPSKTLKGIRAKQYVGSMASD